MGVYMHTHKHTNTYTIFFLKLLQIQLHFDKRNLTLDIVVLGKCIFLLLDPVGVQIFFFKYMKSRLSNEHFNDIGVLLDILLNKGNHTQMLNDYVYSHKAYNGLKVIIGLDSKCNSIFLKL